MCISEEQSNIQVYILAIKDSTVVLENLLVREECVSWTHKRRGFEERCLKDKGRLTCFITVAFIERAFLRWNAGDPKQSHQHWVSERQALLLHWISSSIFTGENTPVITFRLRVPEISNTRSHVLHYWNTSTLICPKNLIYLKPIIKLYRELFHSGCDSHLNGKKSQE